MRLCGSAQRVGLGADAPRRSDPEQDWREKLLGECQDEFFETFGQYDDGKTVILKQIFNTKKPSFLTSEPSHFN